MPDTARAPPSCGRATLAGGTAEAEEGRTLTGPGGVSLRWVQLATALTRASLTSLLLAPGASHTRTPLHVPPHGPPGTRGAVFAATLPRGNLSSGLLSLKVLAVFIPEAPGAMLYAHRRV